MNTRSESAHVSLGAYGRVPHEIAIADALACPPTDPLLGTLSTHRMQLCPQNLGYLDRDWAVALRERHPEIEWRLHANVRVRDVGRVIDLCDWPTQRDYFQTLGGISEALGAPVYSAHAGRRSVASIDAVIRHSLAMTQYLGMPVAIEGHYPVPGNVWLFSSWREYRLLLESRAWFALDLSHLHILATRSGVTEHALVAEMLACERCLEVHVSANDGQRDQHLPLTEPPWWWPLLDHLHDQAVIFSEGRIASGTQRTTANHTPHPPQHGGFPHPSPALWVAPRIASGGMTRTT
ncbi:hypothetical protein A167_00043 [Alcanivorax sp. S71-1-4]|uniref:hypothetical protein n=1 Tax=Alcanivorax sp. S71-1-4 TaxID=1177159 RepID=UPI00135882C4|nr:hypothetical protein [Alcanivorax sp. S71-1-4]KAF0811011.1 hypothetical protein A167_00043 [Alcanivorax sp. S71-1-4]